MSDYLPEAMVTEILLRLPAKSLMKCRAVCKSWKSLLHSSAFIDAHLALRRRNDQNNLLLFLDMTREPDRCSLHCLETGESTCLTRPPSPHDRYVRDFTRVNIEGNCCNGLVFGYFTGTDPRLPVIWNPSIRRFVSLPSPNIELSNDDGRHYSDRYAFGYDMTTDDYKVLRMISPTDCVASWKIEVYSLASAGGWKILSSDVFPKGYMVGLFHNHGVLLSNALHWFRICINRNSCILVFDMHYEIFREMHLPDAIANRLQNHINDTVLSHYAESLAIVIFSSTEDRVEMGHVWVMTQYGVKESWKLLYSVCLGGLDILPQSNPLGLTRNGDIIFEEGNFGPPFYVKSSGEVVRLVTYVTSRHFVNSFIESLVLLGQENAISY